MPGYRSFFPSPWICIDVMFFAMTLQMTARFNKFSKEVPAVHTSIAFMRDPGWGWFSCSSIIAYASRMLSSSSSSVSPWLNTPGTSCRRPMYQSSSNQYSRVNDVAMSGTPPNGLCPQPSAVPRLLQPGRTGKRARVDFVAGPGLGSRPSADREEDPCCVARHLIRPCSRCAVRASAQTGRVCPWRRS